MIKRLTVMATLIAMGVITPLGWTSLAHQQDQATAQERETQQDQPTTQQGESRISALDRQFLLDALEGGQAALRLSELAVQRGTSNEVKEFARAEIQEQQQVGPQLRRLAEQRGVTPPTDLGPRYEAVIATLSNLSGAEFDRAYIKEGGVRGHAEIEAIYQRQVDLGQDQELKDFASKSLPLIQTHLRTARSLASNNAKTSQ
ncbi:MAG TPA: DUF4142 domain-containing protein [Candidatus Caenarcaniphilales bacterium]